MTGTDPEQLRQTIVRAAIPLMDELHTLTPARIAQAAGVDEADLLTVFEDNQAVMQACFAAIVEALGAVINPAEEVRKLGAIRTDQPVAARLVAVIDILDAYHRRLRIDLEALPHARTPVAGTAGASGTLPDCRRDDLRMLGSLPELREGVAKLLEPDQQHLRLPARVLAEAFVGMAFGGRPRGPDQPPLPAEQVVDLFLHGALTPVSRAAQPPGSET